MTEAGGVNNGSPGTPTDTGDLNSDDVDNPDDAWTPVAGRHGRRQWLRHLRDDGDRSVELYPRQQRPGRAGAQRPRYADRYADGADRRRHRASHHGHHPRAERHTDCHRRHHRQCGGGWRRQQWHARHADGDRQRQFRRRRQSRRHLAGGCGRRRHRQRLRHLRRDRGRGVDLHPRRHRPRGAGAQRRRHAAGHLQRGDVGRHRADSSPSLSLPRTMSPQSPATRLAT